MAGDHSSFRLLFREYLSAALVCLILVTLLSLSFAQNGSDSTDSSASANSKPSRPTFSATVKVVNLLATVRNKHGQIINSLSKDDLSLEEDGRPQIIKYFTRETDLPLKLGLLVDTSMSTLKALPDERNASGTFLDEVVREDNDSAFVIHFDRQVELLQDLTQSRQKLESAVGEIAPSEEDHQRGGGWPGHGRGGGFHGGGTLLYDAIYLATDEVMQKQQGRKALI